MMADVVQITQSTVNPVNVILTQMQMRRDPVVLHTDGVAIQMHTANVTVVRISEKVIFTSY